MKRIKISSVVFAIGCTTFSWTNATTPNKEMPTPAIQQADNGTIYRHYIDSPQLRETMTVDIWIPEGCDNSSTPLPVIYMHDGQNLFDATTTWNHQSWNVDSIASSLISQDVITPPIVVGVHSVAESRLSTLMPVKGVASLGLDSDDYSEMLNGIPLRGDEYVDFIASTLKPFVDANYPTSKERRDTYVAGSSMGGLMSIYALCERPDIFGNAICLSTHWSGFPGISDEFAKGMREYVATQLPDVKQSFEEGYVARLYFDHGTTTIDSGYGEYEDSFIKMLKEKGYDAPYLMTYVAEGAPHEEQAWSKRFHLPLIFMLHH